jgi:uncharacterized protein (TIGR02246 family)
MSPQSAFPTARSDRIDRGERRRARLLPTALILAVLIPTVTAAAFAQPGGEPTAAALREEIATLVARQTGLIARRDAAGLAALFTPDGIYLAANGSAYVGRPRILDYYAQLFAILNASRAIIGDVARQNRLELVVPWGDGAWAIGRGVNVAGGVDQPIAMSDHWLAIYARIDGEWKIRVLSVGEDAPRSQPN